MRGTAGEIGAGLIVLVLGLALVGLGVVAYQQNELQPIHIVIAAVLVIALMALALRINIGRALGALETLSSLLPLVAYVLVADLMGHTRGTLRFAEVGAQVIVVLLLVLAVDARFFRLRVERDRADMVATLITMMLLAGGEFFALRNLITGDPQGSEAIAGAIAAGFAAVAVTALLGSARATEEDSHPRNDQEGP